jgi:site-specific recombinase XerD
MRGWDQLLDGYLAQYAARGLCDGSVIRATSVLGQWGEWMKRCRPRPRIEEIDAPLITRFIRSRTSFKSKSTVYGTLSVMRGMGDFLVREGVWEKNPMRWMRGPKVTPYSRLPLRLDRADVEALWNAAAESRGAYRKALWLTVLALLYGTGLRRGELSRLRVADWDRESGTLLIDGRKTGRERRVPVPGLTYRCIETLLPLRHNELVRAESPEATEFLVGSDGRPLSAEAISMGVHRLARRAGVELASLHQFRHTCASDLIEAGVALPQVQRILGHQVIATTMRYTHIAGHQRREAMALHPINAWLAGGAP